MNNEHERKKTKEAFSERGLKQKGGCERGGARERRGGGEKPEEDMKRTEGSDNGTDGEVLVQADLAERAPLICKCAAAA